MYVQNMFAWPWWKVNVVETSTQKLLLSKGLEIYKLKLLEQKGHLSNDKLTPN